MTTLEAGTAVGIEYIPEESRAVAIHEAGHAAAGHVYLKGAESTRLSIRMRGGALGHHQALEKEERFSRFRERGVRAARLGARRDGGGAGVLRRELERRRRRRHERDRAGGVHGRRLGDGPAAVRDHATRGRDGGGSARAHPQALREDRHSDREPHGRRRAVRARTRSHPFSATATSARSSASSSGQAYVAAHNLILANRDAVEQIADVLAARRELFGDELLDLLDEAKLTIPDVDLSEESSWPTM